MQASPSDPDNFPFVVLGNKVDVEGGRTRQVRAVRAFALGLGTEAGARALATATVDRSLHAGFHLRTPCGRAGAPGAA